MIFSQVPFINDLSQGAKMPVCENKTIFMILTIRFTASWHFGIITILMAYKQLWKQKKKTPLK